MPNNKMGAEVGVVMDTISPISSSGAKEFVSRRVVPDPLRLPYSRILHEVRKEIILATYEQRPELPKSATALDRHRERNGIAAAPDPRAVRERIQGLLLDGHLVARICGPSGRVYRILLDVFADGSEQIFNDMEQGRRITAPATLENLIVDLDPARDLTAAPIAADNSGMLTGTVFFYEDEFSRACAEDPVEIEYAVDAQPATPVPQAAVSQATGKMPEPSTPSADLAPKAVVTVEPHTKSAPTRGARRQYDYDKLKAIGTRVLNGEFGQVGDSYRSFCLRIAEQLGGKSENWSNVGESLRQIKELKAFWDRHRPNVYQK